MKEIVLLFFALMCMQKVQCIPMVELSPVFPIALSAGIATEFYTLVRSIKKYPTLSSIKSTRFGKVIAYVCNSDTSSDLYIRLYHGLKAVAMGTFATLFVYALDMYISDKKIEFRIL